MEQMIDTYRCKVGTRRWPMVVWFTIIDVSAVNGLLIWRETHPEWVKPKCNTMRASYLKTLGMELVRPHIQSRSQRLSGLTSITIQAMSAVLSEQLSTGMPSNVNRTADYNPSERGRCHICVADSKGETYKKTKYNANKTANRCSTCSKHVCGKHSQTVRVCRQCNDASDTE